MKTLREPRHYSYTREAERLRNTTIWRSSDEQIRNTPNQVYVEKSYRAVPWQGIQFPSKIAASEAGAGEPRTDVRAEQRRLFPRPLDRANLL